MAYVQCHNKQNKWSAWRIIYILCQQTSPKHWFGNMHMMPNCDVTNNTHQMQKTTTCHWMKPPWQFSEYATGFGGLQKIVHWGLRVEKFENQCLNALHHTIFPSL